MARCPVLRPTYPGAKRDFIATANGVKYRVRHFVIGGWEVMATIKGKTGHIGDKYGKPATSLASKAEARRVVCRHAKNFAENFRRK